MIETMRREGHKALVHTAAASNLGQMLNRICLADGIGLVNIVRKPEQEALLREHRRDARRATRASPTLHRRADRGAGRDRRDAGLRRDRRRQARRPDPRRDGGGAQPHAKEYSRYGSTTHKQVYLYGGLDTGPTEFERNFGMAWGIGGWLLFPFLQSIGADAAQALKARVAAELKTTFASHYTRTVSLAEALQADAIADYGRRATGVEGADRSERVTRAAATRSPRAGAA